METSFLDLRCKEVVNLIDGRRLGHIIDVIIALPESCVLGIVVPGEQSFWNVLKPCEPLFIPWQQITKIGEDAILVEITDTSCTPRPQILNKKKS